VKALLVAAGLMLAPAAQPRLSLVYAAQPRLSAVYAAQPQPSPIRMAQAQLPPIQEQQLPPLQRQWQDSGQAPVQVPVPEANPAIGPAASPPRDMTPIERPNHWVPAGAVRLQALDKVNAQTSTLTVRVGQSATFGSLTITVRACVVRPPDQPADAAAYLDVTDSHPDSPPFNGWILAQEPSVSMMQHPIYDIRVAGCA
jgi:hypothetical protein